MGSVLVLAHYHIISDIVRTKTHAFSLAWVFFCLRSWSDLCCSRMIVRSAAWRQLRPLPGANYCSVSDAVDLGDAVSLTWSIRLLPPSTNYCSVYRTVGLSDFGVRSRSARSCCSSFQGSAPLLSEQLKNAKLFAYFIRLE